MVGELYFTALRIKIMMIGIYWNSSQLGWIYLFVFGISSSPYGNGGLGEEMQTALGTAYVMRKGRRNYVSFVMSFIGLKIDDTKGFRVFARASILFVKTPALKWKEGKW